MLDLIHHLLTQDSDVNTASGGRVSPMIRPQGDQMPAVVFGLLETKFENVTTIGSTTTGSTRSASDIYTIGIACLDESLSDAFDLHSKTRAAMEAVTPGDFTIGSNSYRVRDIHLVDVQASVNEEGEIYVYEGLFEVKMTIL